MDRNVNSENPQPSWRKPAGMIAILAIIAFWAILIASNADLIGRLHWTLQAVFYTVAGIIWIFPIRPLLTWMETGRFR